MRSRWRASFLVLAALVVGGAHAQIPGLPKMPSGAAPADTAPASPEMYSDGTPRGALYHFLIAARRNDYAAAATHLDLSGVPEAERAEQGPILARHLKVVLDHSLWFDLDKISDRPEGDVGDGLPSNAERIGTIQTATGSVDVVLRRQSDGEGGFVWKFSSSLVDRILSLHDEFGFGWIEDRVPERLQRMRFLHLEAWQALGLLVVIVMAWFIGYLGSFVLSRVLVPLTKRTRTLVDDLLVQTMRRPARWAIALAVAAAALPVLHLSVVASVWAGRLLAALAFVTAIIILAAIADAFAESARQRLEREGQKSGAGVVNVVNRIVKALLACIATIGILQAVGLNVTGLIAGLGIGGLAVALAAQKTVENLFGGLTLMADQPVKIGDFCRFGTQSGWVEDIGFRSTRIRTMERSVISVPNAEFSNVQIENLTARDRIRFLATINLRYETTADQLRAVLVGLRRLFVGHPKVAADPLRIRFISFAASSLDVEIQAYVLTSDNDEFYAIREDLLLRMMDVVAASGTGFAFPSRTVYMATDPGVDPDRKRSAEHEMASLRDQGKLPFPDFTKEEAQELSDRLDYPPEGSSSAPPTITPS